ncbi:hypothetical protein EV421DRAFT_113658 [Armillaria borealis]|uniref:Uncharacterized protein n=1 Tax=Armillaria borealis TaxID=47425 RepID=A0AA39JSJ9_9AGAR|nr:hypothetical protein EV421DRAFT_113658 [Armillaria borealis]
MDSPHQRIRAKIKDLDAEITALAALNPESTPRTISKRRELYEYLDESVVALAQTIEQSRPTVEEPSPTGEEVEEPDVEEETEEETGLDKRFSEISEAFGADAFSAHRFRVVLLEHPGSGSAAEIEDRAFRRIIRGWKDEEKSWATMLQPLVDQRADWDAFCDLGTANVGIGDVSKQLIAINKLLVAQENDARGKAWVAMVIQMVEMIRFNKIWKKHDNGAGAWKWKTKYWEDGCREENKRLYQNRDNAIGSHKEALTKKVKKQYGAYKRQQQHILKTREPLVVLYDRFGAAIFMDRVWYPRDQRRSGGYTMLVQKVCKEQREDATETRTASTASFLLALKVLATDKVVEYVTAFLAEYKAVT